MSQLNVLPISTSASVEVIEESSIATMTQGNDDFSQLIDQHLATRHKEQDTDNIDTTKSVEKKQQEIPAQERGKQAEQAAINSVDEDNTNDNQAQDSEQQELAASGKDGQELATNNAEQQQALLASEQLMSFLQKADNTLLAEPEQFNQVVETNLSPLSAEQKALYEAQLLLNNNLAVDLSGAAKTLSTEQIEQQLAQNITDKKQLLNSATSQLTADKGSEKQPVEPFVEGKSEAKVDSEQQSIKITNSDDTLTKAKENAEQAAQVKTNQQQKITPESSTSAVINTDNNVENIAKNRPVQDSDITSNTDNSKAVEVNGTGKISSAFSSDVKVGNAQQNELELVKNTSSNQEAVTTDAASQFTSTQSALTQKITELAQAKHAQSQQMPSKDVTLPPAIQADNNQAQLKANNSAAVISEATDVDVELLVTKDSEQEGGVTAVSNQQTVTQSTTRGEQGGESMISKQSVVNQVSIHSQKNNETIEQPLSKAQEQKVSQALEQEQFSAKSQQLTTEDIVVADKATKADKAELAANASFTNVSGQATQVAQHSLEQQAIELLNPAVATEIAQGQKTNAQLHQETISIFRKDFTDAVKDKVMLMISQKLQQFDITLDPPELGNMQVRVNLQSEQAVVSFVVQNQQAKEALEQNMHKLKDMLAEQGVDVGDANVEQQSQQSDNEGNDNTRFNQGEDITQADDAIEHTLSAKMINASVNAIDYYA